MEIFVRKPVLAIVIAVVLIFGGLYSASRIPVIQFPVLESSALEVTTHYSGLSAEVVQGFVTDPIERAAMSIPGVDFVDSKTVAGMSTVTAWLKLNENSTDALTELTAKLNQLRSDLPAAADEPKVDLKRADRNAAAFYLAVSSDYWQRHEVTDFLNRNVVPILSSIPDVQRVGVEGGRNPALRIWFDMQKLEGFDLSIPQVLGALQSNNIVAAIGNVDGDLQKLNIITNATLRSAEDFQKLVIKEADGYSVKLSDVAKVRMGEEPGIVDARDGKDLRSFLSIWPLPGANEIAIGDELYKRLDEINKGLPHGLSIKIVYDSTVYMRSALMEIFKTLAQTVALVGGVILFMMGSFRVAIVPLVAIPISLLGAVMGMMVMGFTLNLLTILAIVLSVGLVVDDAIVVVENVARYKREGKTGLEAALLSCKVLFKPIIAMAFTLAIVFVPIGFVDGLSGALFKEFAFTMATAICISGVVAVTLSPIMSAYVTSEKGQEPWLSRKVNSFFDKLANGYERLLKRLLNWRGQILAFCVTFALLMVPFFMFSAKELAPVEDQGDINVVIQSAPGSSLDAVNEGMDKLVDLGMKLPDSTSFWQIITKDGGFGGIVFKDFFEREQNVKEILPQFYGLLTQMGELKVLPILAASLPTAGQFDVEMVIKGPGTYQEMQQLTFQLLAAGFESGKFMFVDTDLKIDLPIVRFDYDHERLADLGLTSKDISDQLSFMLSDRYLNRFDAQGRAYQVIPMAREETRQTISDLEKIQIRLSNGTHIPLSTVAKVSLSAGPRVLGKFDQQRSFRIFGAVVPGTTSGDALDAIESKAREILPAGYTIDYAGISRQIKQEGNSLVIALLMSLILVYLALVIQFNSFRMPLIVLLGSVPLALSGSLLFTFLDLTTINIYSQIGIITLVGLVAKNGILITEFANLLMEEGKSKVEAAIGAAKARLQAVLMTTVATIIGQFPLLLVEGPGAEARNSIGIVIVAGIIVGTTFTLIALPFIYLVFTKDKIEKTKAIEHQRPEPELLAN